jgi:DNA modification methylase
LVLHLNRVICGDSRKELKKVPDGFANLVYLDPPFFTNREFKITSNKKTLFCDKWCDGLEGYLEFMTEILRECHRCLSLTGSLYLHCDWHASHYLKVEADKIFGYNNFRNEVIWRRHNAHNDTKQGSKLFGRIHDVIFFYTKSNKYNWNPMYQAYSKDYLRRYYKYVEPGTGRVYALGDLSGPGGCSKSNPFYEFLGIKRYWRFTEQNMRRLHKEKRILQSKSGKVPKLKRYLDEMSGIVLQDVWDDIQSSQIKKEVPIVYPTQKPVRLIERIIEISSKPNDIVLDPFCGSGTTLNAARNLDRNYIGIDSQKEACSISKKRLKQNKMKIIDRNALVLLSTNTHSKR